MTSLIWQNMSCLLEMTKKTSKESVSSFYLKKTYSNKQNINKIYSQRGFYIHYTPHKHFQNDSVYSNFFPTQLVGPPLKRHCVGVLGQKSDQQKNPIMR